MPAVNERETPGGPPATDTISLPLYAGGLVVTLSGILAVSTAIAQGGNGGTAVGSVALLLTLLGFAFSIACRHLKVQSRLIEVGFLAFLAYILYQFVRHRLDISWFLSQADRNDTQLAAGMMWLSVLRSWTLITDDLVLFSCVLTAAMIGLIGTQDVNTITIVYFGLFVLAMTFLLIHQNYLQSRGLASPSERTRPFLRLLPVQVGLTALCGLVVLVLGALLIVPAQTIFANISLAQAIRGLVGSGHNPDDATGGAAERFTDTDSLTIGNGSAWPTSSEVLLHVIPSDAGPHYWRGRTYDLYVGTGWRSTQVTSVPVTPHGETSEGRMYTIPTQALPPGEGLVTPRSIPRRPLLATFEVHGSTDQFYYADEPRTITIDAAAGAGVDPRPYLDGLIDLEARDVHSGYTVSSAPPPDPSVPEVEARLRVDGTDYPEDVSRLYLSPPLNAENGVTTKADIRAYQHILTEIFRDLPPNRRDPYDKAVAIQEWIAGHCTYSLSVKPTPEDVDHVRDFLTHSRRGYCDLFASSMVILARMAGIPARVATGFAPGDRDATGFNLRAMDKHAWAEVYFPNDRWQVFDATIGTRTDGTLPARRPAAAALLPRVWGAITGSGPLPPILISLILLSLAYLTKTELYDRWRAARPSYRETGLTSQEREYVFREREYLSLSRSLARLGLPRRPWETPAEYEARALTFLTSLKASLGVPFPLGTVSAITARFSAARYGNQEEPDSEPADQLLAKFEQAAARARRVRAWRRFWDVRGRIRRERAASA